MSLFFLNQNIYCGYSKESTQKHPKQMLKPMDKKIFTILLSKLLYMDISCFFLYSVGANSNNCGGCYVNVSRNDLNF